MIYLKKVIRKINKYIDKSGGKYKSRKLVF